MSMPGSSAEWVDGWYSGARHVFSPNFGPRPAGQDLSLAVIHAISLPPGEYGGDAIERLFTNSLDWASHPYFEQIRGAEVSAHFVIHRDGTLVQYVSIDDRAWHAGPSQWQGRDNCNDFSVGIELEGLDGEPFESPQYVRLATLLAELHASRGIAHVAGHEHIAPGRKRDPGPAFQWSRLAASLGWAADRFPPGVLEDRSSN